MQKHQYTILHCITGLVITLGGINWSSRVAEDRPLAAFVLLIISVVAPVFIATRVAWAAGFASGLTKAETKPKQTAVDTGSLLRIETAPGNRWG